MDLDVIGFGGGGLRGEDLRKSVTMGRIPTSASLSILGSTSASILEAFDSTKKGGITASILGGGSTSILHSSTNAVIAKGMVGADDVVILVYIRDTDKRY